MRRTMLVHTFKEAHKDVDGSKFGLCVGGWVGGCNGAAKGWGWRSEGEAGHIGGANRQAREGRAVVVRPVGPNEPTVAM